ncbi:hypothetical protein CPLU01_04364 [Colletotrichum plurivorum]|uniref:Uncharacterized protein n=1 Tax=Colletotrichum plurivorum TaxID=2175906 RepID=A0A8H6KPE8_9PEZI|nr:hypothetical protein CPLU01_04364 [Colletotrichum plurivorum]
MAPYMPKPVTLGVDIGSTSTRACLWAPEEQKVFHIENPNEMTQAAHLRLGDYPSAGYPFETHGDVYVGGNLAPDRQEISLKYGFYPLAYANGLDDYQDDMLEQYLLVQPLMDRKNDVRFLARLRQGISELLAVLYDDVKQVCKTERLKITRIGLSIPSQWTLEFMEVYTDIASNDWQGIRYASFRLIYRYACLYSDTAPGAGGGSEHWTYLVGVKALLKILRESNQSGISPAEKREMLEKFNREKGRCGPVEMGNGQHFVFHMMHWPIDLGPEDLEQCFEEAHDRVFALAKFNIEHMAKYKVPPQIIVSGGTSRHPAVQRRLIEFCAAAGAPKPNFITGKSITFSSGKIAQGVAMAASNCLTIQKFMDRGAAFGVQMRQCANRGNSNPERLWDNYGFFLLSKNGEKTHSFKSGGKDECKIICDPFFETHQSEVLHYDRCYDVIELGEKRRREGIKESPPLPLYFDGGTNCAHVDERDFDVTALDFELGNAEKDHPPATDRTQEASEIHVSTAEAPAVQSKQLSPALPYVPTVHSRFVPVNRSPSKQSDLSYPAPRRARAPVKVRPETSGRAKPTWKRGDAPEFNPYTGELKLGPRTPAPKRIADSDWPVTLAKKSRMEETTPDTYM